MSFEIIPGFSNYSISIDGRVMNNTTGRILAQTRNNHNVVQVGMMREGIQCKRSVALLVAKTYLDPPQPSTFDTPIHLDGNNANNAVDNLMWRPRWFAVKYGQQFEHYDRHGPRWRGELIEARSKLKFKNSWDAALQFGLLEFEVLRSVVEHYPVWPTYQQFRRWE